MTTDHPKGELILHPAMWPALGMVHPLCDNGCGLEIFPLTPVEMEYLENGTVMLWHAECWNRKDDPETGRTG